MTPRTSNSASRTRGSSAVSSRQSGRKFSNEIKLYPYQEEAVERVLAEWDAGRRRTLLVMATGTGKTYTFAEVIRRELKREWDANQLTVRALVLAHRDELINQAVEKIELLTGERCAIEKAGQSSLRSTARVVVGSVQSLSNEARLEKFPKDRFSLIVIDEAHHAPANTYLQIIQHFPDALVLGVTATPDRGDQRSLLRVFDSVAYRYDMADAIHGGYLCPITTQKISLKLDISHVSVDRDDYSLDELDTTIAPYLQAVATQLAQICADRKTVIFLPLRRTAKLMARIMTDCGMPARQVDGESKDRKEILRDFDRGDFKVLCNSMLLTEGWDCPSVDCIVVLRPTQSRGHYAQMVGRGTRLSPKTGKTDLLLPDFIWLAGEHDVLDPVSLLGNDDPKVVAACKALLDSGAPVDLLELEKKGEERARRGSEQEGRRGGSQSLIDALMDPVYAAEERERRARAMEEARKNAERRALVRILLDMLKELRDYVKTSRNSDDPIDALIKLLSIADLPGISDKTRQRAQALSKLRTDGLIDPDEYSRLIGADGILRKQENDRSAITQNQRETLSDAGINPEGLTFLQAQLLLSVLAVRDDSGLATPRQLWMLSLSGHEDISNWTREHAALTLKEDNGLTSPLDDWTAKDALRSWHTTDSQSSPSTKTRPAARNTGGRTNQVASSTSAHQHAHHTASSWPNTTTRPVHGPVQTSRPVQAPRPAPAPKPDEKPEKLVERYVDANKFERLLGSRAVKLYSAANGVEHISAAEVKSLLSKGLIVPKNLTRGSTDALAKQLRYRESRGYATPGQVFALAKESVRDPGSWLKSDAEKYLREHGWTLHASRRRKP